MRARLMSHLVAYYPNRESSLETAKALADGGSSYLEIQFPFSDPIADGPAIQAACTRALEEGFSVSGGLKLVEEAASFTSIPLFVMCYANTVFFHVIDRFVKRCADAGVFGLIVPDLPVDQDEGLYEAADRWGIHVAPVVSPSVGAARQRLILRRASPYLYAALRRGITGSRTDLGDENLGFLKGLGKQSRVSRPGLRILAGFGISRREQVLALSPLVHAVVVGSAYIREIQRRGEAEVYGAVRAKVEELCGPMGTSG